MYVYTCIHIYNYEIPIVRKDRVSEWWSPIAGGKSYYQHKWREVLRKVIKSVNRVTAGGQLACKEQGETMIKIGKPVVVRKTVDNRV